MTTDKDCDYKELLNKIECPFTWHMELLLKKEYEKTETEYDNECEDHLPLMTLMRNMTNLYRFVKKNKSREEIFDMFERCKAALRNIEDEPEIPLRVIEYVWKGTQCFVYDHLKMYDQMQKILSEIKNVSFTSKKDLSTLKACKAIGWYKHHKIGFEQAELLTRELIKEDPKCHLWHFLLATNLRRQRRDSSIKSELSSEKRREEKDHFLKAQELSDKLIYDIYVAQMYREYRNKIEAKKAYYKVYNKCLKPPHEDLVLLKLALGLIRFKDFSKAKVCLDKVGKNNPNNSLYLHYYGSYYMEQKLYKEAIPFYEKLCKDHKKIAAEKDYFRCLAGSGVTDLTEYLLNVLDKYKDKSDIQKQTFILDLGICFWKNKNDIKQALEYILLAFKIDPKLWYLRSYPDYMGVIKNNNVYQVIHNEFLPLVDRLSHQLDHNTMEKADELRQFRIPD